MVPVAVSEDSRRMKLSRPLLTLLFVGLILVGLFRSVEIRQPDWPAGTWQDIRGLAQRNDLNLVLVMIDTLRADRLSTYGYERPTSPILDKLAETGIRFEDTLAQSTWTKTSVASLLTGTYPAKNRISRFHHGVPDGATLPAEILRQAGFRTVGVWRNGWVAPNFGFHQGFDIYLKPEPRAGDFQLNPSATTLGGTDQDVIAAATQFLRSAGDERFYLYLHLMDTHQYVYDGSVDFGTTYSDIYDQSIHWVDQNLGTLVAVLQREGLLKRTVLAVVSDHGEAFREHGSEGHARNLYDETTRVPFVIVLPFRLDEPIVVRTPVENVDVVPTLFDLLGLPALPEADGHSLVPLIEAAAQGAEPPAPEGDDAALRFSQLDATWARPNDDPLPLVLIQEGRYRLHYRKGMPPELYDAQTDPGEQHDLAAEQPERTRELLQKIGRYVEAPEPSWGGPSRVTISEMEAGHLRALGYVVDPLAPPEKRRIAP